MAKRPKNISTDSMLDVCNQLLHIDDEYMRGLEEALEQVLGLFDDLIHVGDLVTLGEIDRRHILFVLSQARQALDADYDLNTLDDGDGYTRLPPRRIDC